MNATTGEIVNVLSNLTAIISETKVTVVVKNCTCLFYHR